MRHQLGVVLEGSEPKPFGFAWEEVTVDGVRVGSMTNCVWSPRMRSNIGFALVSTGAEPGARVEVGREGGPVAGTLCELPFL